MDPFEQSSDQERDEAFFDAWREYEEWSAKVDNSLPSYDERFWEDEPELADEEIDEKNIPF